MSNFFLAILLATIFFESGYSLKIDLEGEEDFSQNGSLFGVNNLTRSSINFKDFPGEECNRLCSSGTEPRICYFNWVMEHFHAMGPACGKCLDGIIGDCFHPQCITADGVEKGVMSINRKIPGPAIQVCKNDLIVVDIANHMGGTSTAIHWHGFHQRATPHMDGVPFITQCPIDYGTKFRYAFRATQPGTQFYHAHAGHHKVNGLFGALIVRRDLDFDGNREHFDYDLAEHVMLVSDWMHSMAEMVMPGLPSHLIQPDNVLINGRGQFYDVKTQERTKTPLEVFRVSRDIRYRFRFINSLSHVCPIQIQIEKHQMQVIASDSYSLRPKMVDTLVSTAGERFDFIITADQAEGDYWIRARLIGPCVGRNIEQFAVLRYDSLGETDRSIFVQPTKSIPDFNSEFYGGVHLNHPNASCLVQSDVDVCLVDLESYQYEEDIIIGTPDETFFMSFDNYAVDNEWLYTENNHVHFMNTGADVNLIGGMNNITFMFPSFPLLTQRNEIKESMFCDESTIPSRCANLKLCPCLHRIKVKLNSLVELIIVDESPTIKNLNHPFHLHGYQLHLTGMGQHPDGIPMTRSLAKSMLLAKSLKVLPKQKWAPIKDTISIPSRGYSIVRFRADNPGFWLMHCHFEWHMAVGMGLVLQVGELNEMVEPPAGFPKCGNYMPDLHV